MKIRTSINVVFFLVGIVSFIIMAYIFFELMREHHKEGATSMAKVFLQEAVTSNNYSVGVIVERNQAALPHEITAHFSKLPSEIGEVRKSDLRPLGLFNPQRSFFILYTANEVGEPVYATKEIYTQDEDAEMGIFTMVYWRSILFSLIFATIFVILLMFILKVIIKPLEALKLWANNIADTDNNSAELIHFRYKELSDIADTINNSIEKQKRAIKKEEEFLQFSSHELRTPLAVLRSNIDLIKKILHTNNTYDDKIDSAIKRMDNSTYTMTQLVDTFLHIGRDTDLIANTTTFNLQELVNITLDELSYLNNDKALPIVVDTESFMITTHYTPCQIVLRNIFANAFQHTAQGTITITQKNNCVCISNESSKNNNTTTGFGLGLRLVEKISKRYEWDVIYTQNDELCIVQITF